MGSKIYDTMDLLNPQRKILPFKFKCKGGFYLRHYNKWTKRIVRGGVFDWEKKNFICVIFRGKKRKVSAVCCKCWGTLVLLAQINSNNTQFYLVHVVVATPGRILDLMKKEVAQMNQCNMLVMDEVWGIKNANITPQSQ